MVPLSSNISQPPPMPATTTTTNSRSSSAVLLPPLLVPSIKFPTTTTPPAKSNLIAIHHTSQSIQSSNLPGVVSISQVPAPNGAINKMSMASVVSPEPKPQSSIGSMTTKEWVIPPRPKPGRKPATDTPPTKRKAQNRAAQRAFRERRAARVGELEEHIEEQKEDREKKERELRDTIHTLELDLESFRSKCELLESLLDRERQERIRVETQAQTLRSQRNAEYSGTVADTEGASRALALVSQPLLPSSASFDESIPLKPDRNALESSQSRSRPSSQPFSVSQIIPNQGPDDLLSAVDLDATPLTCGSCEPNGSCACAEAALAQTIKECGGCSLGASCECADEALRSFGRIPPLKRSLSPTQNTNPKRSQPRPRTQHRGLETDFTAIFSQKSQPSMRGMPAPEAITPVKDSCGFCEEGAYFCHCSVSEASNRSTNPTSSESQISIFSQNTQIVSPPGSDSIPSPVESTNSGAVKLPLPRQQPRRNLSRGSRKCGPNGPGTCAQCQADPKSGLFCRSLAANFERQQGGTREGCCGASAGGGCCMSKTDRLQESGIRLSLSCADTYKTLATHRNFDQAADEIGTWLPKLKAVPLPEEASNPVSPAVRLPIEVEAASIMSVLKDFDVRFGQ